MRWCGRTWSPRSGLVGYDWVLSIEHEDSLMSFGEGFRRAVAFLKECMIEEAPPKVYWA